MKGSRGTIRVPDIGRVSSGILIFTINITFSVMNEGLSWHNTSS
jgi:hypothetical protein